MKLNKIEAYKLSDGSIVETEKEAIEFELDTIAYKKLWPIFEEFDKDIYSASTLKAIVENKEKIIEALTPAFESNTRQLTVDLNATRINLCMSYDALCSRLNQAIKLSGGNDFRADADDLEVCMNNLRSLIGTLASSYIEGNEKFVDVFEILYPGDKAMLEFNPEI